ncbi:MAG TPA: cytochrome b/b6 domain-containing protein [Terriglobia bacterium]|nr:cytochrome b/b6 domain-containing protein [Terriglobia bacterium]
MNTYIIRFSVWQRVEHALVILFFVILAMTGLSQEYFQMRWATWLIASLGGVEGVRWIHRTTGIAFTVLVVLHMSAALFKVTTGRARPSIVPTRKDFRDAILMMRYYLRLSDQKARFDRFDYRQKFEYWGMVIGSLILIVTGFMLYFPVLTTRFLPGEFIPAALLAHGKEGLLAFLIIITWHLYNAHLSPEAFPFDPSIFTGKVKRERMEEEHPLEYERMVASTEEDPVHSPAGESPGPG